MRVVDRHLIQAALVAAVVAAYATAFAGQFQFDDWNVIVDEPRVQSLRAWWTSMPGMRPLLKFSYALNWQSGFGLVGFHAVNIALHAANTLLVHALARRLVDRDDASTFGSARAAIPIVAALWFAWHPAQTEAVTYLSGRSTSLAAFFCLASLIVWIDGRREERGAAMWFASPLLLGAALSVKEFAVALPIVMALWAATDRVGLTTRESVVRLLRNLAPHFLVILAFAFFASQVPRYLEFATDSLDVRSPIENLTVQAHAVVYLLAQALWPWKLNADPVLGVTPAFDAPTLIKGSLLAIALIVGLVSLRRRPALAFGLLWFFVWLAPTNSFVPRLDAVNDRQLYLPLFGIGWVLALGWAQVAPRWRVGLAAFVLTAFAVKTAAHNVIYMNEVAFWTATTRASPHNARAATNLGYAYVLADRPAEAESEFRRALAIDPLYTRAAVNLVLLRSGTLQDRNPE